MHDTLTDFQCSGRTRMK